jgi:hypothetical protein
MRTILLFAGGLLATLLLSLSAHAQELRIRPALLFADDDPIPGLRFTLTGERGDLFIREAFPGEWTWAASIDAPLTWDADRNPEALRADLSSGLQISLFRAATPPGAVPTPDDPPPVSYGYVALDLRLAAEAPQALDDGDASIGVAFLYEHDQYHRLWFLPELRVEYGGVACVGCDTTGENTHARLDGEIGWNIPFDRGWVPSPLRPLWVRLRGRAFETWGLDGELEMIRHSDGRWGSGELAYRIDGAGWLHELFVNWRGGDVPQKLPTDRAWSAGASVFF